MFQDCRVIPRSREGYYLAKESLLRYTKDVGAEMSVDKLSPASPPPLLPKETLSYSRIHIKYPEEKRERRTLRKGISCERSGSGTIWYVDAPKYFESRTK